MNLENRAEISKTWIVFHKICHFHIPSQNYYSEIRHLDQVEVRNGKSYKVDCLRPSIYFKFLVNQGEVYIKMLLQNNKNYKA